MRYPLLALFIAAATPAAATQFVVDGDFTDLTHGVGELGYNTRAVGWSVGGYNFVMTKGDVGSNGQYGNLSLWDANNIDAGHTNTWNGLTASGTGNFLAMDGDFGTAAVTQKITGLTKGATYTLSFDYAFGQQYGFSQSVTEDLTASLGSTSVTLPNAFSGCDGNGNHCTGGYLNAEHGFSGWNSYTTTIVASASTETLSFLAAGSKEVPPFALVSDVSLTGGVPEPSTWAMMAVGFAALGYAGFRSSRRKAAFAG